MENVEIWVKIVIAIASFLFAVVIPSIVMLVTKWKAWIEAKKEAEEAETEAERAAAEAEAEKNKNELLGLVNNFIAEAETTYNDINAILKDQGKTGCGAAKKDSVMTKLQAACIEKGVEFDADFWSAKIDELVQLTRKVNSN